jgi:hypothetical protein
MTDYYLVKYQSDWADEMDIFGLDLLTDTDKEYFERLAPSHDSPLVHNVGTNEDIKYTSKEQLLDCYEWVSITQQEYEILKKLIGTYYGHFYYPEICEEEDEVY